MTTLPDTTNVTYTSPAGNTVTVDLYSTVCDVINDALPHAFEQERVDPVVAARALVVRYARRHYDGGRADLEHDILQDIVCNPGPWWTPVEQEA